MEIANVKDLSFTYPQCSEPALKNVSFQVKKGELLCVLGSTGSGKSTLLRMLKKELAPQGEKQGTITLGGVLQDEMNDVAAAYKIGYVMQRPEQQLVTDKVWHELAFGLENMNLPQQTIAVRVAEIAAYFGIESWFEKDVASLSGGQKQLLNLAAVMVMQPELLILDEPTAQLDPIAASEFTAAVIKLNRELGITVIITEHRLEEIIPACDKMLVLERGRVLFCDTLRAAAVQCGENDDLLRFMPSSVRLYHLLEGKDAIPLDVREGRSFIETHYGHSVKAIREEENEKSAIPALEMKSVYFRYERNMPDVLSGLDLTVYEREIYCILGGNGTGKTTTLKVASALKKPYSGRIRIFGKHIKEYKNQSLYHNCLTMLPQDVQTLFIANTVREELKDAAEGEKLLPFDFKPLYERHPYDLSGGEQQLVALAKVLATSPKLLLLDEPTKGIDADGKERLITVIKTLREEGMTVVIVTHDVEFAALCADRCAMFFRGNVISQENTRAFFAKNSFYTTAICRMTQQYYENAVTVADAAALCRINGRK